ncbi:hypothetical protein D9615_006278 [Tricholomella constricta]|uniref:Uncharacterized protein n=1 Tax=Tricholomella constricta TaxID=117010 RepID=A0A8H5HAL1_9AGAR|nr:hypothetical protein D9615_006278 [Tricholomella constricta]
MMVVFEISSAGLTTLRSIQALNVGGPWRTQKKGFMYLLFEQGILYFCVVTIFTVASLALNVEIPGGFLQRLLNAYTLPLSGLMTARFLLHLRKWESKHVGFQSANGGGGAREETTTMDFTSNANYYRTGTTTGTGIGTGIGTGTGGHLSTIDSYIDEFGEDPVRRARNGYGGGGVEFGLKDVYVPEVGGVGVGVGVGAEEGVPR